MADDLAGVFASGWHQLRTRDDAPSDLRLDRVARLGRSGQLDIVEILEGRRLDDDDVPHLANSPDTRPALQHRIGSVVSVIGNIAFVERALLQRLLGATLILVGCAIMVIDVPHLDVVVWSVASNEGLHLSDLIGGAAVVGGIVRLWMAAPR